MQQHSIDTPAKARKSNYVVPLIVGAVILLVLFAVVGGLKTFQATKNVIAAATSVADSFITSMKMHDYSSASALLVPEVRVHTSVSQLKDIQMLMEKRHGKFISHNKPEWFVQNSNGQINVRLTYLVRCVQDNTHISLVLVRSGGAYQVYACHYDLQTTPLFLTTTRSYQFDVNDNQNYNLNTTVVVRLCSRQG